MYSAWDISKYIVQKSIRIEKPINNLKLQKILFYCQVEYIRSNKELLFEDEIECNDYGMMIPSIYYRLNIHSSSDLNSNDLKDKQDENIELDEHTKLIIDSVIDRYKDVCTWILVSINHQEQIWKDMYRDKGIIYLDREDLLIYYSQIST
ncbi:type II toxin-antitoxin system antitoxin SocA domain-containing protein [Clostridium sp. VAP52]|uniref:Panacea domain-containing protein n=1 Tax=Clostridium sp. VAP52 TaxID=2949977 RepID=UPI00207AD5EF|nr:type II toxin-antitoxin system antitoxin SocA domain-containing protein [Clostridium sp. VAP52]